MILAASGVQPLDWIVIGLYFAGIIGMGVYFARKQRTTGEYFLGSRSMPPWVVGLSIIATLLSTISYLATPGEMIKHGPGILLSLFSIPMAYVVVGYLVIPFFMRLPITSAYEYLEARFGVAARMLGAIYFIIIRVVWMSVVVYTAGGAMARMTGTPQWAVSLSDEILLRTNLQMTPHEVWLAAVVLAVGVFTTFYAALGGIRAVIWTDVIQFIILLGGAVFAVCYVTIYMRGFEWITVAYQETKLESPLWSWDPTVRMTVIGIIIHTFAWRVCTYSSDQTVVQRYLTTRDGPAARKSFLVAMAGSLTLSLVLAAVGLAMLAFYQTHPDMLRGEFAGKLRTEADHIFPYFIANQLPMGVTGLIIAALFAAAMSSLDSGVNSLSAVITVDFYKRWWGKGRSDKTSLRFAKTLGLILGFAATLLALFVGKIEGNIVEVTNKSTSCVVGPLFGMFALGMFTKRTNGTGTLIGSIMGFGVGLIVTFANQWFDYDISFTYIFPSSIAVTILVGYLLSLVAAAPTPDQLRFTREAVMAGDPPEFTPNDGPADQE